MGVETEAATYTATDYPDYAAQNPSSPNQPRDIDLFAPTRSEEKLIDIIEADDQWVDDGVPEKPGRPRLTDDPSIDAIPEEDSAGALSPPHYDIAKWMKENHGRADSEQCVKVRSYLYAYRPEQNWANYCKSL